MESLPVRLARLIAGAVFVLLLTYRIFLHQDDDPYRCKAVMDSGHWADPADENGSRAPFKHWRTDGCMFHDYNSAEIRQCMQGRHALFSGDSTTRQVAFGLGRLLDREEATYERAHMNIHRPFNLTYHGVQIQQHWNPFLKIVEEGETEKFAEQLELIRKEHDNVPSIEEQEGPALIMLGVGAWFSKPSNNVADHVGKVGETLANVSDVLGSRPDFARIPMHPTDGIGNQVFFAPPAGPYYTGEDPKKQEERQIMAERVTEIRDWMREVGEDDYNLNMAWAIPGVVEGQNETFVDPTETGFHVTDGVAEMKAQILLNLRCNAKLDRMKGYPYTRTCCTDYAPTSIQLVLVAVAFVYLYACVIFESATMIRRRDSPRGLWSFLSMDTGAFFMAVLLCYYADRTQMFAKGEKHWSWDDLYAFGAPCVVLALISIRKSISPKRGNSNPANGPVVPEPDQPFLSRDQTEEWKGWMQVIILIYHWTGAKPSSIYVFVRLLVAAYLFQTGYGHTTFFLLKKDFSFKRAASVLLRLNLLPVTLAFVMNTDYMFYYFSPLCSFWFVIVWLTLWAGHRKNDDIQFVLAKICLSAVLVSLTMLGTSVNRWAFWILRELFNIRWDVKEWEYRVALDLFVVYTGMLTAIAYMKLKEEVRAPLRWSLAFLSLVIMAGYSYASDSVSVNDYKKWHPYTSFVPILAFIAVRNVCGRTRNYYSTAMAWLGRCSLETYTLQFHIFLAADTRGVLLLDALNGGGDGTLLGDRWRSLIVVVPLFVWVSSIAATATGNLVKLLLTTPAPPKDDESVERGDLEKCEYDQEAGAGLLGRSRTVVNRWRRVRYIPTMRSVVYSLQARMVLIFGIMWFINMMHAYPDQSVPDGWSPSHAKEAAGGGVSNSTAMHI